MARMPDIEREAAEAVAAYHRFEHRVLQDLHLHTPHGAQTPAATPVTVRTTTTEENPMALGTDLRAFADRLDNLGEEVVTKAETIVASPVGATGFGILHQLLGLNIDPKLIERALGGLDALLQAYAPAQPQADGGPQVAGQA